MNLPQIESTDTQNGNALSFSLKQIALWQEKNVIDIPSLQRGLVWSPRQVELFWDSVFRGFPIGSFAITPFRKDTAIQKTNFRSSNPDYFLLDGQQRYNAIVLGYVEQEQPRAVLWLDLCPKDTNNNSTRLFWFKVTTQAHPWGFANNDNCSLLGWQKYRDAIQKFRNLHDDSDISNPKIIKDLNLNETWPVEAGCPIKLSAIFNCYEKSKGQEKDFEQRLLNWLAEKKKRNDRFEWNAFQHEYALYLFSAIERLDKYRIVANVLQEYVLDPEMEEKTDATSNLEVLFTRLNTMGTPISPYDLRYSAIKAYWGDIKGENDRIAGTIMPAANLAVLVFRLALTLTRKRTGFADAPSVPEIRRLGKDKESETHKLIKNIYEDNFLERMIHKVETMLIVYGKGTNENDGLPPYLRTLIIINSPDVYLLLMYVAYLELVNKTTISFNKQGVALSLHWLSVGRNKKNNVDKIKECIDDKQDVSPLHKRIKKAIKELHSNHSLIQIENVDNLSHEGKRLLRFGIAWNADPFNNAPIRFLLNFCLWNQELLIFAQRKFFNEQFDYDPAQHNFVSGHNKPWDIDHIIPKAWMSLQGKEMGIYKDVCRYWLWSNGNYAAIPFSLNRSKSDNNDWSYYKKNADDLFFDARFEKLTQDITEKEEQAKIFAVTTFERSIKIYGSWFNTINDLIDDN